MYVLLIIHSVDRTIIIGINSQNFNLLLIIKIIINLVINKLRNSEVLPHALVVKREYFLVRNSEYGGVRYSEVEMLDCQWK